MGSKTSGRISALPREAFAEATAHLLHSRQAAAPAQGIGCRYEPSPSNPPKNGILGYAQVAPGRGSHGLDLECQRDGRLLQAEPCSQGRADSLADKLSPSTNRTPIAARIHRLEAMGAMTVETAALTAPRGR